MANSNITSFLQKLIDWKEFELFVTDLYQGSDEVTVDHNAFEKGKSGAKYQIDVRVIQKFKLHQIKILIECKRWKSKVDRHVINVMASAIDDLNANKGVIFTTKGYEEGAILYAKSKNIDIFIIRDVSENEWGKPGRFIWFYLQSFNGIIIDMHSKGCRFFPTTNKLPQSLDLDIPFTKDAELSEQFQLYSYPELIKGDNLVRLLSGIRNKVLKNWVDYFNFRMQPESESPEIAVESAVIVNFNEYPFRFLKTEDGYIQFDSIHFKLLQSVKQTKFEFDRAESSDFILIVENYITQQKNFISKPKEEGEVLISDPISNQVSNKEEALENGSIVKVMMDYYVNFELKPDTKIEKTQAITVNVQNPGNHL
jgi:hypothetical protein